MPTKKGPGLARVLIIVLLLAGLAAAVYLVQQRTNFLPRANTLAVLPISPTTTVTPSPEPKPKSCSACGSDINNDGWVTVLDFTVLRNCFGKKDTDQGCYAADITGDGLIDVKDFNCLQSYFSQQCIK